MHLNVRRKALDLIAEQYEQAAGVHRTGFERLNRVRPTSLRYTSQFELDREYLSMAAAVVTFAVNMGLVSPDDVLQIMKQYFAAHSELGGTDDRERSNP